MTARFNLTIREGQTFRFTLNWVDSRGRPINLIGSDVLVEFRDRPDGALLWTFSEGDGNLLLNRRRGSIGLYRSSTETAAIGFSTAAWDAKVTFPSGEIIYPIEGRVRVVRSVTE